MAKEVEPAYCVSPNYTVIKHCCNVTHGHFTLRHATCELNTTLFDSFWKCTNETVTPGQPNNTVVCINPSGAERLRAKWSVIVAVVVLAVSAAVAGCK